MGSPCKLLRASGALLPGLGGFLSATAGGSTGASDHCLTPLQGERHGDSTPAERSRARSTLEDSGRGKQRLALSRDPKLPWATSPPSPARGATCKDSLGKRDSSQGHLQILTAGRVQFPLPSNPLTTCSVKEVKGAEGWEGFRSDGDFRRRERDSNVARTLTLSKPQARAQVRRAAKASSQLTPVARNSLWAGVNRAGNEPPEIPLEWPGFLRHGRQLGFK